MKRGLSILVLICMLTHLMSRLGFVSYLYGQRYEIAHSIGLMAEKPIATCDGDYFAGQAPLVVPDDEDNVPAQLAQAREITLFVNVIADLNFESTGTGINHNTEPSPDFYSPPHLPRFHPPRER